MRQTEARALARKMMDDHGLTNWTLEFDNHKSRLGLCVYGKKTISLSKFFLDKGDDLFRDTVLHEIAHAMAGHTAGHGPEWKRICLNIGANPVREAHVTIPESDYAWVGKCPCGKGVKKNHRKPRDLSGWSCRFCGKGLDWTHNGKPVRLLTRENFATAASVPAPAREDVARKPRMRTARDGRGKGPYDRGFTDIEALFGEGD